jgi:two-component system response regulator HydG
MKKRILVIDDDPDMCMLMSRFLTKNGYEVATAQTAAKGISIFREDPSDIVLCDYQLGDKNGKEVLSEILKHKADTIFLIITAYSHLKIAVEVIKMGAYDYITKPLVPDEILNVLQKALTDQNKGTLHVHTAGTSDSNDNSDFLEGKDPVAAELYRQIAIVAPTNYSIILYGESGTGKEVIAQTIHRKSHRKDKPFVAIDCGTLSKELSGSELFGHVKGSFTGALQDKAGHFEMANGGTLFLDEIANLSAEIQASLLRVIQERKFKRIGGHTEFPVDVRIIVASNENLQEAYQSGKFREDLYHRFNEFSINLPALRHRVKDIPLFAAHFLELTNRELQKSIQGFDDEVLHLFKHYNWPGNLRELRNVVRRSALLSNGNSIGVETLPWEITHQLQASGDNQKLKTKDPGLKDAAAKAEYETIVKVLKEVKYNKSKAAEILQIDRKTLYNKIRTLAEIGFDIDH